MLVFSRKLAARLLPHLSTECLIQAIGNVESRDDFAWLRARVLQEVDRCLGNAAAVEAFEYALAAVVMPAVLQRTYLTEPDLPVSRWLDEFFAAHWPVAVWSALRQAAASRRRAVHAGVVASSDELIAALTEPRAEGGRLRGLIVTRDADPRTARVVRQILMRLADERVSLVWLRVNGGGGPLHTTDDPSLRIVDAPVDALRDPDAAGERLPGHLLALARDGDPFARLMTLAMPGLAERFAAGHRTGVRLADGADLAFALFFGDKYPFARGLIAAFRAAAIPTFAYFPSIELGAPAIYRYAVDHLFVPNAWTKRRLTALGFDARRIWPVGSTEVDQVAGAPATDELPAPPLRVLFLTKWPDCAIRNAPLLEATIAGCERTGQRYHIGIRRHPRDRRSYAELEGATVTTVAGAYERQLAWANLVVSGMSNSVFHTMALGTPCIVANTNPKIDLGQRHLFDRADVPAAVRYVASLPALSSAIEGLVRDGLRRYDLPDSLIADFFHSLDGRTAERITTHILAAATGGAAAAHPLEGASRG